MTDVNDLDVLVGMMRTVGRDTQLCEVKAARKEMPKDILPSISAFANKNGGTIILGLSEKDGFEPVPGFDAQRIYSSCLHIGDNMHPIIRPDVSVVNFEQSQVVVIRIPALARQERPCYIDAQGPYTGSYIRTGDGDRRLTRYEVDRMMESRGQPRFDVEPIVEASITDLDSTLLEAIVQRNRINTPRVFGKMDKFEMLVRLGAVIKTDDQYRPTLAGLLVAGIYPQQYFPRLNITFTVYAGTTKALETEQRIRYLDTASINGSIADMLQDATTMLRKNMRTGAIMGETLREDIPDYPIRAFREAMVNALQHRDYSPEGRSSQVQVNMYADRLEILNPGGLYGPASLDTSIPGLSATRNVNLSRLLESIPYADEEGKGYIIENRGTGLTQIREELSRAHMPPPQIQDYVSAFSITFGRRNLTETETVPAFKDQFDRAFLNALMKVGSLSIAEIVRMSGVSRSTIGYHLRKLVDQGLIETLATSRSPKQRYRLKRSSKD